MKEAIQAADRGVTLAKAKIPPSDITYCGFCVDANLFELETHGGCAVCGNNGVFDYNQNSVADGLKT